MAMPKIERPERMTPAEFRVLREYLGLSGPWLTARLGISSARNQRGWESGAVPIPTRHAEALRDLAAETDKAVAKMVARLRRMKSPVAVTYWDDETYVAHEGDAWTAQWHRAVTARAVQQVPEARITYAALD